MPCDENGLVGKHEDKGPPRGYDRERLERRVQHERAADHVSLLAVPGEGIRPEATATMLAGVTFGTTRAR